MPEANQNFKIDFIGIGLERAGTTWIFECLKEHPQICCSKYKEVKFFSQTTQFNGQDDKYQRGVSYYASYFSHCQPHQIKGEFSPYYFFEPDSAQRIKKHFPQAKLILCLRNPIERAYSFYGYEKSRGKISSQTFEQAIEQDFSYFIDEGFYTPSLKNYFDLFPKENILILIYDDIIQDPVKFMQKIYSFLGVDDKFFTPKMIQTINTPQNKSGWQIWLDKCILKTKQFLAKRKWGRNIINNLERGGLAKILTLILERKKQISSGKIKIPPMQEATRKRLQQLFKGDIKVLEQLVGRDLSAWQ